MVLTLIVSTLQFSIYKMECLITGNTQISLSDFDDCNQSKKEDNSISQKCCDFNDITFNFDYNTNIQLKDFNSYNSQLLFVNLPTLSLTETFSNIYFNFYTNLPPPSGIELLKLVQIFRL